MWIYNVSDQIKPIVTILDCQISLKNIRVLWKNNFFHKTLLFFKEKSDSDQFRHHMGKDGLFE